MLKLEFANNKKPIVSITTPRIKLATPNIASAAKVLDAVLASVDDIYPWLPWATKEITMEDMQNYIKFFQKCHNSEKPSNLFFDVWTAETEEYLGNVYFGEIDWRIPSFNIGYWLDSRRCGHGYMTEAVNALAHVACKYFKAHRLAILTSEDNLSAKSIPERLNFQLEASFKNHHLNYRTKQLSSTLVYSCIDAESLPQIDYKYEV